VAQTFFIPVPEDQVLAALGAIFPGRGPAQCDLGPGPLVEDPVVTYVSIAPVSDGTVIVYDHWEDGYEADVARPVQPTTEVWGDGDAANGAAPGLPGDLIGVGQVVVLHNEVSVGRRGEVLRFDGGDRVAASLPVAVTRAAWASGTGTRLAGALEVGETREWGRSYRAPVGVDVPAGGMFEYSALVVMASDDDTRVAVDADADGVDEETLTLDAGQSALLPGVHAGATVSATAPVQVNLVTGDICALYQSRWYTLLPVDLWSGSYSSPVGSAAARPTSVFAFNPGPAPISLGWETSGGRQPDVALAAGAVAALTMPVASGARFFSADGSPFFALAAVDSGESQHDWGFALIPERLLTPQALLGWGAGRDPSSAVLPDENGSPAWVSAVLPPGGTGPVAVCADFDGDGRGDLVDPYGGRYDRRVVLDPLSSARVYDPDGDQTGMVLYVCDDSGARLAVAWGQDPARASPGEPGLDLGTTVPPLPALAAAKEVELAADADGDGLPGPGDTLRYEITIRNTGRVPLGEVSVEDEVPAHTAYVPASTLLARGAAPEPLSDAGTTPFPLDEGGATLGTIPPGGVFTVTFLVVVDDPLPPGVDTVVNVAVVRSPGTEEEVEATLKLHLAAALSLRKTAEVHGAGVGTGTVGYWKNHPAAWPVDSITVGGVAYRREEAIAVMGTPGAGDRTYDLFRQLVAAMLNALAGADPSCVAAVVDAADAWMAAHPPGSGVRSRDAAWAAEAAAFHAALDDYNNGRLCAPHRDDPGAPGASTGVTFTIEVENTGNVPLEAVLVQDPAMPACDADLGALAPGQGARYTCEAAGVRGTFTNVAIATGVAADGTTVRGSGEVVVEIPGGAGGRGQTVAGTRTAAQWRRLPRRWPLLSLDAGGRTYGQPAARRLMAPGADPRSSLLRELFATRLNLLAGTDPACIGTQVGAADAWLAAHPRARAAIRDAERRRARRLAAGLARYNRGALCAPPDLR